MKCPQCDNDNPENARFCGNRLGQVDDFREQGKGML